MKIKISGKEHANIKKGRLLIKVEGKFITLDELRKIITVTDDDGNEIKDYSDIDLFMFMRQIQDH